MQLKTLFYSWLQEQFDNGETIESLLENAHAIIRDRSSSAVVIKDGQVLKNTNHHRIQSKTKEMMKLYNSMEKKDQSYVGARWFDTERVIYRDLVYRDNEVAGALDVTVFPLIPGYGAITIMTSPLHRRQGVAVELVQNVLEWYKSTNFVDKLRWCADTKNIPSNELAVKMGFKLLKQETITHPTSGQQKSNNIYVYDKAAHSQYLKVYD